MKETVLIDALILAVQLYGDRRDKAGELILFHALRVARQGEDYMETLAGLFHDAIEDGPEDAKKRVEAFFNGAFDAITSERLRYAIQCLTRKGDELYAEYITRLRGSGMARKVKVYDLKDNLSAARIGNIPDSLIRRYANALVVLC